MIGQSADQLGLGLGPTLRMVGGGGGAFGGSAAGATQPALGADAGAAAGSAQGSVLLAWGVLAAILVAGYLFFAPITL